MVAASQKRNLRRLRAAEAKCNELQHRWGPRAAEEDGQVRWTPRSAHPSSQEETPARRIPQNRRGTSSVHSPPTSNGEIWKKPVVEEPQRKREIVTVSERPAPREWRLEAERAGSSRPKGPQFFWRPGDRGACRQRSPGHNIRSKGPMNHQGEPRTFLRKQQWTAARNGLAPTASKISQELL